VGFEHNELTTKEVNPVVVMKETAIKLSEVVVVGYKTTRKINIMAGGISVVKSNNSPNSNNENPFSFHETNFQKCATQIKALGNPTATNEVIIVPQINETTIFVNSEDKSLAENWYAENAFQNVESVAVYDLSGILFETNFLKINDGKIKVNLKNVPSGMCIVRVTYTNERSLEGAENSVVRVMMNR
jgi:hypothetical protein